MATQWSDYQQTQGYLEWFYYVKFAVVSAIGLGFAAFSVSRMIVALKGPPAKPQKGGASKDEKLKENGS